MWYYSANTNITDKLVLRHNQLHQTRKKHTQEEGLFAVATLDQILDDMRALVEDPEFPAVKRWLQQNPGGKVLGSFQVYFPEELAHAAGMLPVKVAGAGASIECKQADARIASFVCSVLRTSLELGLSGRMDFLSMYFTTPICDAARNVCGIWTRNFPNILSQILYLPQNATSAHAVDYLQGEYRRVKALIEEVSGNTITDEKLRASIAVFNENRRLLHELYRVKRDTPWLISTVEAYVLTRAAGLMPREEHNRILREVLAALPNRPAKKQDKIRVVYEGGFCEQPALDMLAVIQEACYIVEDDFMIGLRYLKSDVPLEGDPIYNLAHAYLEDSTYSPVQHDSRKRKEKMLLERVRGAGAEAVIVSAAKMCEPGLEEQVGYTDELEHAGIPHMVVEFEEKMTIFEQMRMEIETFVESLMFDFDNDTTKKVNA